MGNNRGFTLIEMMVAVTIFVSVVTVALAIFVSSLQAQRQNLAYQQLLDQTSFVTEYMSRAIRMAKKELSTPPICLTVCGRGCNYETNPQQDSIKFIDYNGVCTEFFLENEQLKKRVGADVLALTSPDLTVSSFNVNLSGQYQPPTDYLQPLVTIFLEIVGKEQSKIQIKTSISQRNLDIWR